MINVKCTVHYSHNSLQENYWNIMNTMRNNEKHKILWSLTHSKSKNRSMAIPVTLLMSLNDKSTGGPYMFKSEGLHTHVQQQQNAQIILTT